MTALCMRPTIEPHKLRDGRTYDQCKGCGQISPLGDDGTWAAAHRGEANAANTATDREVKA
jgi:hypothetical protein